MDIPITAEHIDALGHVNNATYVKWMQDVAIAHSDSRGWPMSRYLEIKAGWVVSTHFIKYLRPAYEGEVLQARTWIGELDDSHCIRRYEFTRKGKKVVIAETRWAWTSYETHRPCPIPKDFRDSIPINDEVLF